MAVSEIDLRMKIWQVDWKKNKIARMFAMLARRLRLNKVFLKPKIQNRG